MRVRVRFGVRFEVWCLRSLICFLFCVVVTYINIKISEMCEVRR